MSLISAHLVRCVGLLLNRFYRWMYAIKPDEMHIWNILCRHRPSVGGGNEDNCITYHKSVSHASDLLKKNNYVMNLTESQVVLAECHDDVYNVSKYSFFYNAIFDEAALLKTLTIEDFLTYVESIDYPNVDVLFLWSTGRCGSTMLAACFEALDNCVSLSEPLDVFVPWELRKKISPEIYHRLLEATLKYHLYQILLQKPETKLVLIKTCSWCFWYPVESSSSSRFNHAFMYRDLEGYYLSSAIFAKVYGNAKRGSLVAKLTDFDHFLDRAINCLIHAVARYSTEKAKELEKILYEEDKLTDIFTGMGTPILYYIYSQLLAQKNVNIVAVKYEEVRKDTISIFQQLLQHINKSVSDEEMERVLESTKRDSQENTSLSSFNKEKFIDPFIRKRINIAVRVLAVFGMEYMSEKGAMLQSTLTS